MVHIEVKGPDRLRPHAQRSSQRTQPVDHLRNAEVGTGITHRLKVTSHTEIIGKRLLVLE
jgi:hypothetical protein